MTRTHINIMKLLRRVLIAKGQLIPQTEDEVRLFEESVNIDDVVLPDRLSDPFAIFDWS